MSFAVTGMAVLLLAGVLPAQDARSGRPVFRECNPKDASLHAKKSPKPKKGKSAAEIPLVFVCAEVNSEDLAVQEFLQKYVREQRWNLSDEQLSEDLWTFSLELNKEQLTAYAKLAPEMQVDWSGGKALVNVRTSAVQDGYTRVLISVRIDGDGEPEDKVAPKPKSWPLPSSGNLESLLLEALKSRLVGSH